MRNLIFKDFDIETKEECGVFGVYFNNQIPIKIVSEIAFSGLLCNQHRGEESAGITFCDGKKVFLLFKKMGLVKDVFNDFINKINRANNLKCLGAITHTRYSTTGSSNIVNAGPFLFFSKKFGNLGLSHNGNITNASLLKEELIKKGYRFFTTTDSEIIGNLIIDCSGKSWEEKITKALNKLEGSFSLLLITKNAIYGARDHFGNRPLSFAKFSKNGIKGYAISSETPAFYSLGMSYQREIKAGELIKFSNKGLKSIQFSKNISLAFCGLEIAYLMRPDSRLKNIQLDTIRRKLGQTLARKHPVPKNVNYVTYIPESAKSAAEGFTQELSKLQKHQVFLRTSMLKGRYGIIDGAIRGFINPQQNIRTKVAHNNYFPFDWLKNKKIVLIDDSIIRGTTTARVIKMIRQNVGYLKNSGASEVHVRIVFPPVIAPCPLGIDINEKDFLIARELVSKEKIAKQIFADSLEYLSPEEFSFCVKRILGKDFGLCLGCTTKQYPVLNFQAKKQIFEEK